MKRKFLHGGDYNPEQWLAHPDVLKKDLELFKKAKINTVTLGVFSWSVLEPEEGHYEFGWLEDIINSLHQEEIQVILATPSGARPKWLADKYPEVLRVGEDRRRSLFGGRHNHCYTSPVYREKIGAMNEALSMRFGEHPAVKMWHISNEYGGECHCELCQDAFRAWLRERYQSIDELNEKWCTTFWSHRYQSFEQVESPSSIGETGLHALNLNWRRFVTSRTKDFLEHEIRAIKKGGSQLPVTTNLMYSFTDVNYDELAQSIDVVSWDSYPLWHKREDIEIATDTGFWHDYMRSLKNKPFLLMESCPTSTNWQSVSKLKKPGLLEAASLQGIGHGADSVLYFQMRQSRGSFEKFHGAVIDHSGRDDTRVFKEVSKIGEDLEKISLISEGVTGAQVALVYDVENRWALEDAKGPRNRGMGYMELLLKMYRSLKRKGLNVDIISSTRDISAYQLVAIPMLYLLRESFAQQIEEYVKEGGSVLQTYWSGVVDEDDLCYLGDGPHLLTEVLGVRRKEIDGLYDWEENHFQPAADGFLKKTYRCNRLCEIVEVGSAKRLMEYQDDFYKGEAAVTCNDYGQGKAYYVAADVEESFYDDLFGHILEEKKIKRLVAKSIPEGLTVDSRVNADAEYVFLQNYNKKDLDIGQLKLEGELLLGESLSKIKRYETLIIKKRL
ncbi:beta-galactosidase [Ohessyouella blattaphilus]|uniref:Beta-galactosidase n=1 Tax=Ohessyouella blattaphilus TaxID=2949333 RepID=A0ABT1EKX5_9FIRM|nr:beta-galactosidase [Ohessyouella blattaphilus]MCP1111359.1 beta-galactosidase [Ohessyouella blattaphilus]MCR8564753.1 beta-galactosidase [Ohessyouella blattaphilus]